jgi:hypothetical protein
LGIKLGLKLKWGLGLGSLASFQCDYSLHCHLDTLIEVRVRVDLRIRLSVKVSYRGYH